MPSAGQRPNTGALDLTAPVVVKNPFGEGKVQVDDLDFTAIIGDKTAGAASDAGHAVIPGNLSVGAWVEIREKSGAHSHKLAKLSFITPLKTRFLFVNRQGQTVLDCSRAEVSRLFKLGEMIITVEAKETPLFDRAASGIVNKLAGPKASR